MFVPGHYRRFDRQSATSRLPPINGHRQIVPVGPVRAERACGICHRLRFVCSKYCLATAVATSYPTRLLTCESARASTLEHIPLTFTRILHARSNLHILEL
jgi:hypothetical protein